MRQSRTFSILENVGESGITGPDLDLSARVNDAWNVRLGYVYTDSEIERFFQATSRSRLSRAMSNCACAASQKWAVDRPMVSRSTARLTGMRPCPAGIRLIFAREIFSRAAARVGSGLAAYGVYRP